MQQHACLARALQGFNHVKCWGMFDDMCFDSMLMSPLCGCWLREHQGFFAAVATWLLAGAKSKKSTIQAARLRARAARGNLSSP